MTTNYQLKAKSAAFTGHRSFEKGRLDQVKNDLCGAIRLAYSKGFRNFYCGMARGFDLLAAETVCQMKTEFPDIELTAVVPCPEQCDKFPQRDKFLYAKMLNKADHIVTISHAYYKRCFLDRNDYMIEHASLLIAYYKEGKRGGTAYTIAKARHNGLPIIHLYKNL
jgi:Uncharacterized protein conserved in bacteria